MKIDAKASEQMADKLWFPARITDGHVVLLDEHTCWIDEQTARSQFAVKFSSVPAFLMESRDGASCCVAERPRGSRSVVEAFDVPQLIKEAARKMARAVPVERREHVLATMPGWNRTASGPKGVNVAESVSKKLQDGKTLSISLFECGGWHHSVAVLSEDDDHLGLSAGSTIVERSVNAVRYFTKQAHDDLKSRLYQAKDSPSVLESRRQAPVANPAVVEHTLRGGSDLAPEVAGALKAFCVMEGNALAMFKSWRSLSEAVAAEAEEKHRLPLTVVSEAKAHVSEGRVCWGVPSEGKTATWPMGSNNPVKDFVAAGSKHALVEDAAQMPVEAPPSGSVGVEEEMAKRIVEQDAVATGADDAGPAVPSKLGGGGVVRRGNLAKAAGKYVASISDACGEKRGNVAKAAGEYIASVYDACNKKIAESRVGQYGSVDEAVAGGAALSAAVPGDPSGRTIRISEASGSVVHEAKVTPGFPRKEDLTPVARIVVNTGANDLIYKASMVSKTKDGQYLYHAEYDPASYKTISKKEGEEYARKYPLDKVWEQDEIEDEAGLMKDDRDPKTRISHVRTGADVRIAKAKNEASDDLPSDPKSVLLRAESDRLEELRAKSKSINKVDGGSIPVGAEGFDAFLKAEVAAEFIRAIRQGKTADEARADAYALGRSAVEKHNAKRPKDVAWQRWDDTARAGLDATWRKFKAVEKEVVTHPMVRTILKVAEELSKITSEEWVPSISGGFVIGYVRRKEKDAHRRPSGFKFELVDSKSNDVIVRSEKNPKGIYAKVREGDDAAAIARRIADLLDGHDRARCDEAVSGKISPPSNTGITGKVEPEPLSLGQKGTGKWSQAPGWVMATGSTHPDADKLPIVGTAMGESLEEFLGMSEEK